ncbi:MAG TPA: hypothetical protein VEW67_05705 [Thermoleophilaceae bacterium]|nr:hypothetical protein [Thermoleophilaceae bacterium]
MSDQAERPHLVYVRDSLARHSAVLFMWSALIGVAVVVAFDWNVRSMAVGTAIGTVVWGAVKFFPEVLPQVPRGPLPAPPEGASLAVARNGLAWRAGRSVMAIALCVALAWLADRWDVGAFFAPGQFAGYMCAYALGALLIARWERKRGQRVLFDPDEEGEDEHALYATDSDWRASDPLPSPSQQEQCRSLPG